MSKKAWQDRIVSARMAVDREFNDQIQASSFSNQQWGLIMTATEFAIENPEDPENARLVADTESLPQIMSEVKKVRQQQPGGGGGGGGGSSGSLVDGIKSALGIGSGGSSGKDLAEAEELTQEYAQELQKQLESKGRWEEICEIAAEE